MMGLVDDVSSQEEVQRVEEGIDISVNLPRKKVKGPMMLSGGNVRLLQSRSFCYVAGQSTTFHYS